MKRKMTEKGLSMDCICSAARSIFFILFTLQSSNEKLIDRLMCQNNMKLVFRIPEDDSEMFDLTTGDLSGGNSLFPVGGEAF
jgi:hypothetical protein